MDGAEKTISPSYYWEKKIVEAEFCYSEDIVKILKKYVKLVNDIFSYHRDEEILKNFYEIWSLNIFKQMRQELSMTYVDTDKSLLGLKEDNK